MSLAAMLLLLAAAPPQGAAYTPGRLVTITVAEDRGIAPHQIVITRDAARGAYSAAERDALNWRAERISDRGVDTITTADCPALREIALSLADLPPIPMAPPALHILGRVEFAPPSRKDGYSTRLTFTTRTDDGSWSEVQVSGGHAYALWGHDAVAGLIPCWGAVEPSP